MATKNVKKNELPKITKKWYEFKIDPKTIRPVRFSWMLSSGEQEVIHYSSPNKDNCDVLNVNLRNCISSYYFVLDKANKRIFAYPIQLTGHQTRSSCKTAYYEKINSNTFYMWDKDKQLWEIPYKEYQRYLRYDYQNHQSIYETVKAEPCKMSRLSTYYYKVQAQLPSYIREIFAELYGNDFVYQNKLVADSDIRDNSWIWINWLQTKGRKYSDKTIQATDDLMNKISSESRLRNTANGMPYATEVVLETVNGTTVLCYYYGGQETFRQIFNVKTGKMENFIWKQDKWQKSGKLSNWQTIKNIDITQSYKEANPFDVTFLDEALKYFKMADSNCRRYWYSSERQLYEMIINYISHPAVHQILQLQDTVGRQKMYASTCKIESIYGKMPNKGRTLFAKLGVNKYQFKKPDVIVYVKWLLELNNISHIDNDTWDRASEAFKGMGPNEYYDKAIIHFLKSRGEFSVDRWINICKLEQADKALYRGSYYTGGIRQLYKDYYASLAAISEFGMDISGYPLIFNNKQQLQRYHDEASRAVSAVKNRAQDEKFEMLYDKRLKMLEDDGTHMITMPKCSSDLVEEGSYLHHCVGGYVNSVANGSTAIYFLRQSSAPNTPWLTVEVRNKQCVQIHGACNAWMGSKDEYFAAVPFLSYWFDKHDIECNDNLLTNMATGYGAAGSRRALPTAAIQAYKASRKNKK